MLSAGASVVAKVVSVSTALITVPLTFHYLGVERYGMWMIMSSMVAMLAFADFGIGNGLLNIIAAAHGRDDNAAIRAAVSSGLVALCSVGLFILTAFAISYSFVPWFRFFNVHSALAQREAGPAIAVFVTCFALSIPSNIVLRTQMGLQRGFVASLWQCLGSVVALCAVLLAILLNAGLPWLVLAFMGGPLVALTVNSLIFFGSMRPDLAPGWSFVRRSTAAEVARTGALFFLLQIAASISYNAHNLIIAQILGVSAVAQYAVPDRLFSFITMAVTMALTPLWPAYRESLMRGDIEWMRRTLYRSIRVAVGSAAVLSTILVVAAPWLIQLWVGGAVKPPFFLILGLGLWKVVEAVGLCLAMFLNGAHVVKPQLIFTTLTAATSIALEIYLVRTIGVSGSVWATLTAFVAFALIPYAILTPRIMDNVARSR